MYAKKLPKKFQHKYLLDHSPNIYFHLHDYQALHLEKVNYAQIYLKMLANLPIYLAHLQNYYYHVDPQLNKLLLNLRPQLKILHYLNDLEFYLRNSSLQANVNFLFSSSEVAFSYFSYFSCFTYLTLTLLFYRVCACVCAHQGTLSLKTLVNLIITGITGLTRVSLTQVR